MDSHHHLTNQKLLMNNLKKEIAKVSKKIEKLNDKIDNKIVNGKSYKAEAVEHKNLVAYLRDIKSTYKFNMSVYHA